MSGTLQERTDEAARALLALYGHESADYLRQVLGAGWMTDAEYEAFRPLREAISTYEIEALRGAA